MKIAAARGNGWFWLVQMAASAEAALLFLAGAYLRDAEALGLAFIVLLTLGWILFRPGRAIPVIVRSLVFADVAVWMVPAAVSNARSGGSLGSIALPAALGTTAIVGLIAAVGFLVTRRNPTAGRRASRAVAGAALVVILGVTSFAAATGSSRAAGAAADLVISATNARYSTTTLTADRGTVAVDFINNDLFWHTFTVTELGVDIRLPVKGNQRLSFSATPGTYEFFCAIPGHKSIGMRGTLVIR
jgi:plastocyanin